MFLREWPDGLVIREITEDEYQSLVKCNQPKIFAQPRFMQTSTLTGDALDKATKLRESYLKNCKQVQLGAFLNGQFAGWHYGLQDGPTSYYMMNSAVLPEYRRRKIYERILEATLDITREYGFLTLTSRHHPTNNAVIIPKLKRGFSISGSELTDAFGLVIKLSYFHQALAQKVFSYRSGYTRPDDEIKKILVQSQ